VVGDFFVFFVFKETTTGERKLERDGQVFLARLSIKDF
jgi:hypothetical protein